MAGSAEVEFNKKVDADFCLIAYMASTTRNIIWYIDSGASCHMTGHKQIFKSLQEGGLNLHIELGDDAQYQAQGVGIVRFRGILANPLVLLMYCMFQG